MAGTGRHRRPPAWGGLLDVLVNFDELPSLLKFISLEDRLSELTGVQIDLVMEDSLRPNLGKRVLQEVVRL